MKWMRDVARWLVAAMLIGMGWAAQAQAPAEVPAQGAPAPASAASASPGDYVLGPGDSIRIFVYQSPDLTLETRVGENGTVSYPLIGSINLRDISVADAEKKIANALKEGNFLKNPQVSITLLGPVSNQISVLGQVNKPGKQQLMAGNLRLSEVMANAGGIIADAGSDIVVITGTRNGQSFRREVDFSRVFAGDNSVEDMVLSKGDTVWVDRAPVIYIYGEVNSPGARPLRRDMTVLQAIAMSGGLNQRGTMRGIVVHRKDASGKVRIYDADRNDKLEPNDIVYIKESLF